MSAEIIKFGPKAALPPQPPKGGMLSQELDRIYAALGETDKAFVSGYMQALVDMRRQP